jgi:hypothetical protein
VIEGDVNLVWVSWFCPIVSIENREDVKCDTIINNRIAGWARACTIGVIASWRLLFFRLPSWLPRIMYVGAMLARLPKKPDAISTNSGEIWVFVCAMSPQ